MIENDSERQLRRDLKWAVASPLLMRGADLGQVVSGHGLPAPQDRYAGHRVGHYFETLLDYWLRIEAGVEMLAHGLQIRDGGRTLGELDFVFRNRQDRVCHWEVAVKFYLYCADRQVAGSHFIGPNARDTFERKWDRMQRKQLPLCRQVFPHVEECSAFVKGRIFYHPEQVEPARLPEGLMPDHLKGIWLRHSELAWLEAASQEREWVFCVLQKPLWLAPVSLGETDTAPMGFEPFKSDLDRHFLHCDHPILVGALRQGNGGWEEHERLFIVSDLWPGS